MAPTTGAGAHHPGDGTDPLISAALTPLSTGAAPVRDYAKLARQAAEEFESGVARLRQDRAERGGVHRPEDTHELIRRLHTVMDHFAFMEGVGKGLRQRVEKVFEEELLEAVGEDTPGIPARSMKVPTPSGTISLTPKWVYSRDVDMDQVLLALAQAEAIVWHRAGNPIFAADDEDYTVIVDFAVSVCQRALSDVITGAKPKVTGIEATATLLGKYGEDRLASATRDAVGKRIGKFTGVKVEYKSDEAA